MDPGLDGDTGGVAGDGLEDYLDTYAGIYIRDPKTSGGGRERRRRRRNTWVVEEGGG